MQKPEFLKINDLIVRFDKIESVEYGVVLPNGDTHDAIIRMSRALTLYNKDGRAKKDIVIHFALDGAPAQALKAFFNGMLWGAIEEGPDGAMFTGPYPGYDGYTFDLAKAYQQYAARTNLGQTVYNETPEPVGVVEKPRINRDAIRERLKEVTV